MSGLHKPEGVQVSVDEEKRLVYFESEEDLVRRLGAAVVVCWKELDRTVREQLIDQAERVLDESEFDHFEERLKNLIEEHGRRR